MKTVLITGATGALGRAVLTYLRKDAHWRIVATSRHDHDAGYLQLDTRNREQIFAVIKNTAPDLVVHLAATFVNDYDEAYGVNVASARHLLDAVRQCGFRTRVVLIGSAAEYGAVRPEENPVREDHVLSPISLYGLTKAWQTQLAGLYAGIGLDVVVARIFNLEGPGLSERLFVGRLQKQIEEVLSGQKTVIELGPLTAIRDYISTDEAAAQILAIAALGVSGSVYHVASGQPVVMRDLLLRYLAMHQLDASIVDAAADLTNRSGSDVPVIYADIGRTRQLLNSWRTHVET